MEKYDMAEDHYNRLKHASQYDFLVNLQSAVGAGIDALLENEALRLELDDYKAKYDSLLEDSIKHANTTTQLTLALLTKGLPKSGETNYEDKRFMCKHERLDENGICRQCGQDKRGI